MGVFSATPMSFRMDRKSPFASHLKSLIFEHLLHFLPDSSDDVLAEYITVLVCNGKNQNQAREDLEAFLGERSWEFVSWLWHLLLEYEHQLTAVASSEQKDRISSNPSDTYRENDKRNGKSTFLQSQGNSDSDNLMGEEGERYCFSSKACKSYDMLAPKDHPPPPSSTEMISTVKSSARQSRFANGDFSKKVPSSLKKLKTKNGDSFEERCPASSLGRHPDSFPGKDVASGTLPHHVGKPEHPQMHYTANVSKRSFSPLPLVSSSYDNKLRRSVWDRLGKPTKAVPYGGHDTKFYVCNKSENTEERISRSSSLISKPTKQIRQLSPSFSMPAYQCGRMSSEAEGGLANRNDDSKVAGHVVKTISQVQLVNNIRRKRHFGEVSNQQDDGTTVGKSTNNQPEEVIQARKRSEVQMEAPQAVVSQLQDVKLRLRQVEIEMAKLRSKQLGIGKDGKTTLSTESGLVKPTDEDVDSKTVLVTNVHYKATKEALTMYFQRCGVVANVAILNDDIPSLRSAYVTFESKKSTDRALGHSGKTFYSRTIMVSRKGDMPDTSSARFVGKKGHFHFSHSTSNVTPDRYPFHGSHLQWRRDSLASHSESPASTDDPRKKTTESFSQQDPSTTLVLETAENSKPCLTTSAA